MFVAISILRTAFEKRSASAAAAMKRGRSDQAERLQDEAISIAAAIHRLRDGGILNGLATRIGAIRGARVRTKPGRKSVRRAARVKTPKAAKA